MSVPKAVVFDIGNVLIQWQPERFFDTILPKSERERLFSTVDLHAMNDRIDRGENFRDVVFETAAEFPEFESEIRLWHDRWLDIASPLIDGSIRLNRALRAKGISTAILSNIGEETYALAAGQHPSLGEFDAVFLSGRIRAIKPEDRIYAEVERGLGLSGPDLLFADDRADNLAAAARRGWQVHLFTTANNWARTLVEAKLLTATEAELEEG